MPHAQLLLNSLNSPTCVCSSKWLRKKVRPVLCRRIKYCIDAIAYGIYTFIYVYSIFFKVIKNSLTSVWLWKIYMRKSGKSMLCFEDKNTGFYIEGHTLKTNCIRFLILFYWRKNMCPPFWKIYFFFARAFFHFFTLFFLWFISTQSDFGANKRAFKHCTPLIMVPLASSTLTHTLP